jgi:hypothetical protein
MNFVSSPSLSALLLVAAAFTMPSGSASARDIVLGASVQLTGPVANTGRYYRDAYQLAIDKINAAGGVKIGNESHKLALKLYDNQSDVNLSVRQYTQWFHRTRSIFCWDRSRAISHWRIPPCLKNTRFQWFRVVARLTKSSRVTSSTSSERLRRVATILARR